MEACRESLSLASKINNQGCDRRHGLAPDTITNKKLDVTSGARLFFTNNSVEFTNTNLRTPHILPNCYNTGMNAYI